MRDILIDITRLVGRKLDGLLPTGVDRVSLAYIAHYQHNAQAIVRFWGRSLVFSREDSTTLFSVLLDASAFNPISVKWLVSRALLSPTKQTVSGSFLFNTGHSGLEKPEYAAQLTRQDVNPIFFVHDLIPISHPEYCREGELAKHLVRMNTVLDIGAGVICNSEFTQDALTTYALKKNQPMPPTVTALLAPAHLPKPDNVRLESAPYFVMLSTIEGRKNHWMMLQVWRKLVELFGVSAPKLVLIGRRGWECENTFNLLDRSLDLKSHVIELPGCSDEALSTWLSHAQALLFPSFVEGYGMPLVEALDNGIPAIASDLSVFKEIAGNVPEYLDPLDGPGWVQQIVDYSQNNSPRRLAQLERMRRYTAPSWSTHFKIVDAFLERLS
jgi:glycosyltransferase involved in cell wall biosynthesis